MDERKWILIAFSIACMKGCHSSPKHEEAIASTQSSNHNSTSMSMKISETTNIMINRASTHVPATDKFNYDNITEIPVTRTQYETPLSLEVQAENHVNSSSSWTSRGSISDQVLHIDSSTNKSVIHVTVGTTISGLDAISTENTLTNINESNRTDIDFNVAGTIEEVVQLHPSVQDSEKILDQNNISLISQKQPRLEMANEGRNRRPDGDFSDLIRENAIRTADTSSSTRIDKATFITTTLSPSGEQGVSRNITKTRYITLLLQKNCTDKTLFQNTMAVLNTHLLSLLNKGENNNVNINPIHCHTFLHLKFAVYSASSDIVKTATKILSANITLGGDFKVLKAYQSDENFDTTNLENTLNFSIEDPDEIKNHGEIIAYVIAAFSCLFVLILFATLCCVRCTSSKQANSLDLCDIPHLNLKLEDYKIMPIPRPSISCQDYGRELLSSTYGESRNGDTLASHHKLAIDTSSSLGNTLHRETILARQELRSFDSKQHCSRVQSLDMRPKRNVSSWVNNSREKLNMDFERRRLSGIDNGTFDKW